MAEQELLVEESALPESFLLASNKAEATSILVKLKLKSNLSLSLFLGLPRTHFVPVLALAPAFPTSPKHFYVSDVTNCVDIKGCHTPQSFSSSSFLGASQSLEPAAALPPARLLLRSSCWGEAAQAVLR